MEPFTPFSSAKLVLALRQAGLTDLRLAEAFEKTQRVPFVPGPYQPHAWDNVELPLDCGQTMTRPVMIGQMFEALDPKREHNVLEIGTGSGYASAVLSRLCREVHTLDRYRTLVHRAQAALEQAGVSRVDVHFADGREGWSAAAPYDRVLFMAAVEGAIPRAVVAQMAPGAVAVAPVIGEKGQRMMRFVLGEDGALHDTDLFAARFTPLEQGVAREL
ncbi:MAG: protein-L-isoaspartate(D-aspartate) O-methyltransferase [Hyphomonadaceae bacterium]